MKTGEATPKDVGRAVEVMALAPAESRSGRAVWVEAELLAVSTAALYVRFAEAALDRVNSLVKQGAPKVRATFTVPPVCARWLNGGS